MLHKHTVHPPPNKKVCLAKADSAASSHFWTQKDANVLEDIHEDIGPPVKLPNASTINDTKAGYLPNLKMLSKKAKKTRILKDLKSANLISLPQLADDGCVTSMDDVDLVVEKDNKIVLTGTRNPNDGLYDVPIPYIAPHPNPKTSITENNFVMPKLHSITTDKNIKSILKKP